MTSIPWESEPLDPATYERMVACLLNNLDPRYERIDGSGGDGGRDVQFETPEGLVVWELKSFTDRMTKQRRRQVERSLKRAAELRPSRWELIVPIDPTPEEKTWFDGLRRVFPFPMEWRGMAWLDTQFAEREFIANYFLKGAEARVFDLLRQIREEQAGLTRGLPDVVDRVRRLAQQANELDPYYRFELSSDGQGTKVAVIPRYAGAMTDRPITVSATIQFTVDTPEGQAKFAEFERAIDFGLPIELEGANLPLVVIDAPAGLGGKFEGMKMSIRPYPHLTGPVDLDFLIVGPAGEEVLVLPTRIAVENAGRKGMILAGADRSGLMRVAFEVAPPGGRSSLTYKLTADRFVPHDLVPSVRFLANLHAPNRLIIRSVAGDITDEPMACPQTSVVDERFAQFVCDLALVQAETGIIREVSGEISVADAANASAGAGLVRGEEVLRPWTSIQIAVSGHLDAENRRRLSEEPIWLNSVVEQPATILANGATYRIGERYSIALCGRAAPETAAALLTDDNAALTSLVLVPEDGNLCKIRIVPELA